MTIQEYYDMLPKNTDAYYSNKRISQSQLKLLLYNPKLFLEEEQPELYFEEKKHFVIGGAVDTLLTQPETFNDKYYVSSVEKKPSDTVKSIIHQVYDNASKEDLENSTEFEDYTVEILQSCIEHDYCLTFKNGTRVNKVLEFKDYWNELIDSKGKIMLSLEESDIVTKVVKDINSSPLAKYFKPKEAPKGIDIQLQMPILFDIDDIGCKALLDIVVFDHNNKTITPIDLKTMSGNILDFPKSVKLRGYSIQAAWYTEALRQMCKNIAMADYKIENFCFIVASTTEDQLPVLFQCTDKLLEEGKFGRDEVTIEGIKFNRVKGYLDLIDDYKWYIEHGFHQHRDLSGNFVKLEI